MKGTCFGRRVLSSFFFSHPEPCLKIEILVGKSDVSGSARRAPGEGRGRGEMVKKKKKKTEKHES